jgi:hypothetical protein
MSDTLRTATIRLAFYNPELRGELLPLLVKYAAEGEGEEGSESGGKKKGPPPGWDAFLKEKYDGGKKKVKNPNPKTKDAHPEVSASTALKDKGFRKSVMQEYSKWRKNNPDSGSGSEGGGDPKPTKEVTDAMKNLSGHLGDRIEKAWGPINAGYMDKERLEKFQHIVDGGMEDVKSNMDADLREQGYVDERNERDLKELKKIKSWADDALKTLSKKKPAEAKKEEGEGEKAEKKEFRTIALPAAKGKQLSKVLEGWGFDHVSSPAAAGKPLHEREVRKTLKDIDALLNEWKTDEEIPRPSAQDSKQLNTAKRILEETFGLGKKKKKTSALRTATIRLAYANPELRPVLLPLLVKAATDPKQAVKSVYKDHERDFKSLHARIVDMKKDSSFNSLKAKTDLNVVLESLDMLKRAGSVEDYAEHAQAIEAACGKVLAKGKTDGIDDLMPLVKDAQKGAKAVAAKAGE